MRRARDIRLVLLGGGVLLALGGCEDRQAECDRARAEGRADAAQLCERAGSSSRGSSGSSGSSYGHASPSGGGDSGGSGSDGGHSSSSRGGFGASAHAGG